MADGIEIIKRIDEVLGLLVCPITEQEVADGWTQKSRIAMQVFFEDLRGKLIRGEPLPAVSIARGMDHWGIIRGEILEKAAEISNKLRELD